LAGACKLLCLVFPEASCRGFLAYCGTQTPLVPSCSFFLSFPMLSSDSNIYENLLCIRFYSLHLVLNYIIIPTVQMRKPRFGQSLVQTYKVSSRDLGNHFLNYTSETFWGSKVQALSWTNGSWVLTVMAGCKGSPQEERAGRV
jgi:hypothetical protein